jgi:hypothetical protein
VERPALRRDRRARPPTCRRSSCSARPAASAARWWKRDSI